MIPWNAVIPWLRIREPEASCIDKFHHDYMFHVCNRTTAGRGGGAGLAEQGGVPAEQLLGGVQPVAQPAPVAARQSLIVTTFFLEGGR